MMRSIGKFLLLAVLAVALLAGAAAAAIYLLSSARLERRYAVTAAPVALPSDAAALARGGHLATVWGCRSCHGDDFGGAAVIDDLAMGRVFGPNLTAGRGGLGAGLTTADWVRAVRQGVGPDGRALRIMPSKDYAGMSDADLGSLIAYIRSLPPVDRKPPPVALGPVSRLLLVTGKLKLSADVIDHSRPAVPTSPVEAPTPAYGAYLASTCTGCHNPHFSGGRIAEGPPSWPPAANLTQGPGSAVKGWTEQDFIRTLRTMRVPDGRPVNPVMPSVFGQMNDTELRAIWAYIQTLPAAPTGRGPQDGAGS